MSALRAAPAPAGPLCAGCLGRPPAYLRAIVAFDYEPPGVALIGQLKTRLRLSLALVLARLLGAAVARAAPLPADAVLAAVPASRASLRRRGMNPAMEIARSLAEALDLPLRHGALLRLRETPRQAGWAGASAAPPWLAYFVGRACAAGTWRWWTT